MAIFNGLFKSSYFQVFHQAGKLTKASEKFFAEHPNAKKIVDCVEKACDEYGRAMGSLKSEKIGDKRNAAYEHNYKLYTRETKALCWKIIAEGAKMVITDFTPSRNMLVFTEDMVLFWAASLFNDGVYIHPAPYKDKFMSHIHTRGVEYYYYYQSPNGDKVWLGETFDKPANQLHTAEGYAFAGDRKEDHKLDAALAQFLDRIWKE